MKCPYCDYISTSQETLDGETEYADGDVSLCIECGEAGLFEKNEIVKVDYTKLSKKTEEEFKRIRDAWLTTKAQWKVMKK